MMIPSNDSALVADTWKGSIPENESGLYVDDLENGASLELETQHHRYLIVKTDRGETCISGHPYFCPEPVAVQIEGSAPRGSLLRKGFIGRGMHLTFEHPIYHTVTTSRILELHRVG